MGAEVESPRVLAVFDDEGRLVDQPAQVKATISSNGRHPKVVVFKFKRKKQYKRTIGHRQDYTELQVGDITYGS